VGKTTVSAAYAVHVALSGRRRVLILSTDPAHSLGDVLQMQMGDRPVRVALPRRGAQLFAWQINAQKEFDKFLGGHRDAILDLAVSATLFTRKEIEPLLDTTLPGMAEVAGLLALHQLLRAGDFDEIVVDTAPLGHTLRLFELPEHFARFLNFLETAASRDRVLAETFGGTGTVTQPIIARWRRMVKDVQEALSAKQSRLMLVTTPEKFALNESVRGAQWIGQAGLRLKIDGIVLNRVVVRASRCPRCTRRARATREAQAFLRRKFPKIEVSRGEDPGSPIMGAAALAAFGKHVFQGEKLTIVLEPPRTAETELTSTEWPAMEVPLSLTLGKGGVGKTTISAGLAYRQRRRQPKVAVTICSTDPAPSLDDVFASAVGNRPAPVLNDPRLEAMEMDSVAEFETWSERAKQQINRALSSEKGGLHVDLSFDRRLLIALLDVVPPGVDEIFAIFRILDLLEGKRAAASERAGRTAKRKVLIDMAPTGHALELLRMPRRMQHWARLLLKSLAAHRKLPLARDVAVEIATVEQRARELAAMLRDGRESRLWPVMLAEPLPDRETARLLREMKALEVPAKALFVNRVLFAEDVRGCARCTRARGWQQATLRSLRRQYRGVEVYCVREFPREIAGAASLRSFTSELWRMP
jgi:arsenite/tail-anchored protein-transporting ATPase